MALGALVLLATVRRRTDFVGPQFFQRFRRFPASTISVGVELDLKLLTPSPVISEVSCGVIVTSDEQDLLTHRFDTVHCQDDTCECGAGHGLDLDDRPR